MVKVFLIALILIAAGIYIILNADYFTKDGARKHKESMAKIGIKVFKTPPGRYIFIGIIWILAAVVLLLVALLRR